jgi:hypothetical protein
MVRNREDLNNKRSVSRRNKMTNSTNTLRGIMLSDYTTLRGIMLSD